MSATDAEAPASQHAHWSADDVETTLGYGRRELANVLRSTAAEIEARGWCQNTTKDAEGKVCLLGALHIATYQNHIYGAALSCLWDQLALAGVDRTLSPIGWNDAPGRTVEQVLALCNAAADRLEAKPAKS